MNVDEHIAAAVEHGADRGELEESVHALGVVAAKGIINLVRPHGVSGGGRGAKRGAGLSSVAGPIAHTVCRVLALPVGRTCAFSPVLCEVVG